MVYVYWSLYGVSALYMSGYVYRHLAFTYSDREDRIAIDTALIAGLVGCLVGIMLPAIIVWKIVGKHIFLLGKNHSERIEEYSNKSIKDKEKRIKEKRLRVKELEKIESELDAELASDRITNTNKMRA